MVTLTGDFNHVHLHLTLNPVYHQFVECTSQENMGKHWSSCWQMLRMRTKPPPCPLVINCHKEQCKKSLIPLAIRVYRQLIFYLHLLFFYHMGLLLFPVTLPQHTRLNVAHPYRSLEEFFFFALNSLKRHTFLLRRTVVVQCTFSISQFYYVECLTDFSI